MYIPPKHHIPALEDPIAYYYIPVFRSFFIKRLEMCLSLLPPGRMGRLLDVGCGTGIILPELFRHTDEIWAVDNFLQERSLKGMMKLEKISANLAAADLLSLPFRKNYFDVVMVISILEHIKALDDACLEIRRVLKPGGRIVAGFPTMNAITDRLLGGSTGFHVSSHKKIIEAMSEAFSSFKVIHFPGIFPVDYSLYVACSGVKADD